MTIDNDGIMGFVALSWIGKECIAGLFCGCE
jgi:hypothetical protein